MIERGLFWLLRAGVEIGREKKSLSDWTDRSNSESVSEKTTKQRILDAAEKLMTEQTFHSVGLNQILKAVNVPKGSFYHHFASKEDFGVELLRHYSAEASACKRRQLLAPQLDSNPLERLMSNFERGIMLFEENGGKCPCLIVKLASEVTSLSEKMREVLAAGFEDWVGIYAELLEQAKAEDLLPADFDSAGYAQTIQDLWYGALQRAMAYRSVKPLRHAVEFFKKDLLVAEPV